MNEQEVAVKLTEVEALRCSICPMSWLGTTSWR